jgi:hypothetical protein
MNNATKKKKKKKASGGDINNDNDDDQPSKAPSPLPLLFLSYHFMLTDKLYFPPFFPLFSFSSSSFFLFQAARDAISDALCTEAILALRGWGNTSDDQLGGLKVKNYVAKQKDRSRWSMLLSLPLLKKRVGSLISFPSDLVFLLIILSPVSNCLALLLLQFFFHKAV